MATPHGSGQDAAPPRRVRLRLGERPGDDRLDGGWWPRSLDVGAELHALLPLLGSTADSATSPTHVLLSRDDWSGGGGGELPTALQLEGQKVDLAWSAQERHLVVVTFADGTSLGLLLVPPDFTPGQGEEALLAAATAGNAHSAVDLLHEVTDQPDVDPLDHWATQRGG